MSQRDELDPEVSSHEVERDSNTTHSEDETEPEQDSFEDAVDTSSVRSLTKRSVSASRPRELEENDIERSKENKDSPSGNDDEASTPRRESPLSRRISNASNLENVNLDDESTVQQSKDPHMESQQGHEDSKGTVERDQPHKTISLSSITNALPSMPWSPSSESPGSRSPNLSAATIAPPTQSNHAPNPPPPPARKLTSPFSWLSRNSSGKDKDKDPVTSVLGQVSPRRNTVSSVTTLMSNPEMMLNKLEEENGLESNEARSSLKNRFKLLRMREEACIPPPASEDDKAGGATASLADSQTVSLGNRTASNDTEAGEKCPRPPSNTASPSLAPGTASGIHAGPSAMSESQVDWDLWQSVVYEGPAAVARTSAEELNRAIANGIPSAIRGVIWQVLAQSKNDELESVYQSLVDKGTDRERNRRSNSTTAGSVNNVSSDNQKGERDSSPASSVHSNQPGSTGAPSPKAEKSAEVVAKEQAVAAAEKKRKDKQETTFLQKLEKTIRRDLGARTSFSKYAAAAGLQDGLFGVCKAYALYDEGVGYAQGMNFLVMPLLFNVPEQEAFCLLVRLMNQYHVRDMFVQDMPGLHMRLYQFERLLEDLEPALYCHLHRRGISPHLYATQWFLTFFAYRFPLQLVLRIYDLTLSEGLSAILRFGIVLMQKNAETLLSISDMHQLTVYLRDKLFDVYIDKDPSQGSILESGFFGSSSSNIEKEVYRADKLVADACEVKITPELLALYTSEWEEKSKSERERETEQQDLRSANHNFSIQIRKLEERVEVCDREQAALATELVRTKVENQELKDENESLKGQVRELKVVIDKQPLEIEEKWQLEREDLMKRNENVHQENQKLERELADLEEQLVQTKMHYAEINDKYEALTRKWSDVKRQFS